MSTPVKAGSDNQLEDYFLDLVINKHALDREIHEILDAVNESSLHPDYQALLRRCLFGENNLYLENWGTLSSGLLDIVAGVNVRGKEIEQYGIVLGVILRVIEEVFDVDDAHVHDFLLSVDKEDVEHRIIILVKRVTDFIEEGLQELLSEAKNLEDPIVEGHIRKEYDVIKSSLKQFSRLVLEEEGHHIHELKAQVDMIVTKIHEKKKKMGSGVKIVFTVEKGSNGEKG